MIGVAKCGFPFQLNIQIKISKLCVALGRKKQKHERVTYVFTVQLGSRRFVG